MRANLSAALAVLALLAALGVAVYGVARLRARRGIATAAQRATYDVLHTVGLAAEPLRAGLSPASAGKAVRHLRTLIGAAGLAVTDTGQILAFDGTGEHHRDQLLAAAAKAIDTGRSAVLAGRDLPCDLMDCPIRGAVVVPLRGGSLVALADGPPAPGLVQATRETGRWVAAQLALAELDTSRARLARAEVRALRAQISPHFIYNALTAIASFVRTDPERARELILEFAEFTRYSFRAHGEFTTLAEELRSIDRYLTIERARFGERLQVRLQIAPEVLPVGLPFLCLQPLVENAVRHGLSAKPGVGTVSIVARDAGAECHITVEDDGVGMEPSVLTGNNGGATSNGGSGIGGGAGRGDGAVALDGGGGDVGGDSDAGGGTGDESSDGGQHVGLSNVDDRLRAAFGDQFGLVVETAPGAGTKVSMRVPKFHPGVRAGRDVSGLRVLAVDDEPPALDELAYLLRADPRVSLVHTAPDATDALRVLRDNEVDAVFLDIRMPGLDGMELARVLGRFAKPPAIVFVTAYDDRAVEAFELAVADYIRKPVQTERLAESLRRVSGARLVPSHPAVAGRRERTDDPTIPVELAGVTKLLPRSSVRWVEAQGDYARLHTSEGSHLVRVSLATLAERWADAGFVRIHRSYLVQLRLISELRLISGAYVVAIDGQELPVARRHTRDLKDRLVRAAKQNWNR